MLAKALEFKHISHGVTKFERYVKGRKEGTIKSLKVSQEKVNRAFLDGFEWNKILTIGGLSGSGKSLILEQWKRDFVDCNSNQEFEILSFEFEMLIQDQVARNVSGQLDITTKDIYSGNSKISDEMFRKITEASKKIQAYPIWYVDTTGTVESIKKTIESFIIQRKIKETGKGLVITIDHTLLTKGKDGEMERIKVNNLYQMAIEVKKYFDANDMKVFFIMLSQLNRDIEGNERVMNNKLHYPTKNDLFASSAAYYSSDYVLITHKPASIRGIQWYGMPLGPEYPHGLPTRNPQNTDQMMVYWHVIKNRGDQDTILMMVENFKYSKIEEWHRS